MGGAGSGGAGSGGAGAGGAGMGVQAACAPAAAFPSGCDPLGRWFTVPSDLRPGPRPYFFESCQAAAASDENAFTLVRSGDQICIEGASERDRLTFDAQACSAEITLSQSFTNPSESWTTTRTISLQFPGGESATGDQLFDQSGFLACSARSRLRVTRGASTLDAVETRRTCIPTPAASCAFDGRWAVQLGMLDETGGDQTCANRIGQDLPVFSVTREGDLLTCFDIAGSLPATVSISDACALAISSRRHFRNPSEYWNETRRLTLDSPSAESATMRLESSGFISCFATADMTVLRGR
jgi:hypothetical protein